MCDGNSTLQSIGLCKHYPCPSADLLSSERVSCRAGCIEVDISHTLLWRKWDLFEHKTRKPASWAAFLCERVDRLKGHSASCLLVSVENQSITFDSSNNTPPAKNTTHLFSLSVNM